MLDWICDALGDEGLHEGAYTAPNGARYLISFPYAEKMEAEEERRQHAAPIPDEMQPDGALAQWLSRENPALPPLKTSVTALVHSMLRQAGDEEETPEQKRQLPAFLPPEKPLFLQESQSLSGAERGTVIHRALGLMDLALCRQGRIREALDTLADQGIFTHPEARVLKSPSAFQAISAFYESDVGQQMLASPHVRREWSFTLSLHTEDGEFVQGTIDLCFEKDNAWVLCDYKTDALDEDALRDRYTKQLTLYAQALSQITGKPVRTICIYSLHLKKTISVHE